MQTHARTHRAACGPVTLFKLGSRVVCDHACRRVGRSRHVCARALTRVVGVPTELKEKRQQIQALQMLALFLPEANRSLAALLLSYLNTVAQHAKVNKMDHMNLAVCLTPTLFRDTKYGTPRTQTHRGRRSRDAHVHACMQTHVCTRSPAPSPSAKQTKAALEKDAERQRLTIPVLQLMIEVHAMLWKVPIDLQVQIEQAMASRQQREPRAA
jgi:hypothetical protein